jgi:hypothetical protein
MARRAVILVATVFALGAAAANAAKAPSRTVQSMTKQCSVTVSGPSFHVRSKRWTQDYGGGTSCEGGVGTKTLTIYAQVLGQNGRTWFTISGSRFAAGPTNGSPLRLTRSRSASLGHVYRSVATATLTNVPNGHAGCSLSGTCSVTYVITATSRRMAP